MVFSTGLETRAFAGFVLSGFLFSVVGALLPAWGYDVSSDFAAMGRHFLAIALGVIVSAFVAGRLRKRLRTRQMLVIGCVAASLGLAGVAAMPNRFAWHFCGVLILGIAAGLLHTGLFEAILPSYDRNPARSLNIGGACFGAGCILCALLVSGTYWAYSVETILLILSGVPAFFALLYAQRPFPPARILSHPAVMKQFQSAAAIFFSLLLFFQFGNEWSIAGWLPLFLIHRLGMSPASALRFLAFYFAALTAGRVAISYLLPRVNSWRLLAGSALASLLGCMLLGATDNRLGVIVSLALLGLGFAAIYPLVAAWIGQKFPYYHPGFFNGIFSIALVGGMLAPWLLGEIAHTAGLWAIITLPAAGTCMVMLLLCLIWVQSKVTGE